MAIGSEIIKTWRSQIPLMLFVVYSICTLFWSTYFLASVYELSQFIFATLIGVYIAVRFKPEKVFKIIVYYSVFSILASALLLVFDPSLARIDNAFFQGAWRGIYWHRNHLGSLMAFFSAILLLELAMNKHRLWLSISLFVCFILAAVMVFGSRSATGILIFFILNGMFILGYLWVKFQHRLIKKHYKGLAVCFGLALLLAVANIEKIFALLGRNSTLTGRVPVWIDLLTRIWVQKPILGYGFGALWNQEAFRLSMTSFHKWGYMMYFSDNGFLDILLNTGLIGLLIFLVFFVITGIRSTSTFIRSKSLISFVPLILFSYVFWANISYSFLLEVDQFVWLLLIFSAVLPLRILDSKTVPNKSINNPQP
jgi:exopolysaccharide production protein ExoQ